MFFKVSVQEACRHIVARAAGRHFRRELDGRENTPFPQVSDRGRLSAGRKRLTVVAMLLEDVKPIR
jgi:hypothetical protein